MVAQQIANNYKIYLDKDDPKWTTWALLIKKKDYQFEEQVEDKAGLYTECGLPGGNICIMVGRY